VAELITAREFEASDGVAEWRVLGRGACACFRTGSFPVGVELVETIGALAEAADRRPDVDLRPDAVTVRLPLVDVPLFDPRDVDLARQISAAALELDITADPTAVQDVDLRPDAVTVRLPLVDVPLFDPRDVDLARQISAAALELDITADPAAVQDVDLTIDALSRTRVLPFWRAVLGYEQVGEEDLVDASRRSPAIWFQPMSGPRPQRNRLHIDVWVAQDQAETRVAAALAAGGHLVSDEFAPAWWTLADEEGNEVDVATWRGRD
jgi:4a-hydroxytetrahydrobiopterin dehydratase